MSQRQRNNMLILAHIREPHRISLKIYGRSGMIGELQELGLKVGHRRVGRSVRENDSKTVRTHKFKATTDSNYAFNIAPDLLDQSFSADAQTRNGPTPYPISGPARVDCIWQLLSRCSLRVINRAPLVNTADRLLGNDTRSHEAGHGDRGAEHGGGLATDGRVLLSPHGSWLAILAHMTF